MQTADELFASCAEGAGRSALSRLSDSELRKLCSLCDGGKVRVDAERASREEQIGAVLRWKCRKAREGKEHARAEEFPASAPAVASEPPISPAKAMAALQHASRVVVAHAFQPSRPRLRVVSFNSLKLRVDDPLLADAWTAAYEYLSCADVVALQEVPSGASAASLRVGKVLQELQTRSGKEWSVRTSRPIGSVKGEIHVVLAKAPLVVEAASTLAEANGAPLSHCALIVHLKGGPVLGSKSLVVTSVHMPPVNKQRERCVQTKALLSLYKASASTRQGTPFSDKGARDARRPVAAHVLCGDWNCPMASDEAAQAFLGGEYVALLGTGAVTTVGGKQYDNFVASRNLSTHFEVSSCVDRLSCLQNSSTGQKGLSDHSPIRLDLVAHGSEE